MSSAASAPVAYFWSVRTPLAASWRDEVARFVAVILGVALDVAEGEESAIRLSAGTGESAEFRFVRRRGGGAVILTSGSRLVLVSLAVTVRPKPALSDSNGDVLETHDARTLPARIPFTESAEVKRPAEEVGLLPRRVRLAALWASPRCKHGSVLCA